jgi:hypothetical protein
MAAGVFRVQRRLGLGSVFASLPGISPQGYRFSVHVASHPQHSPSPAFSLWGQCYVFSLPRLQSSKQASIRTLAASSLLQVNVIASSMFSSLVQLMLRVWTERLPVHHLLHCQSPFQSPEKPICKYSVSILSPSGFRSVEVFSLLLPMLFLG